MISVEIATKPELAVGAPRSLFSADPLETRLDSPSNYFGSGYDVGPEAQRFLVILGSFRGRGEIVLVRNWVEEFGNNESDR